YGPLRLGWLDAELLHAGPDGRAAHAEQPRGAFRPGEDAARVFERACDVLALHFLERQEEPCGPSRLRQRSDVLLADGFAVAEDDRALQDVGELTHVAGPVV